MTNKAIFGAGCFWGVEQMFKTANGVIETEVGYTGGHTENPTYEGVCRGDSGHIESVSVTYDTAKTTYKDLVKFFFEIHDFEQKNGQGLDIGSQYLSVIFYCDDEQKEVAEKVISELRAKGYDSATKLEKATKFWPAEEYHQDYYAKTGGSAYCHIWRKVF
ncbi:peptide-methionine (S)-S-oxide reductase [Candidatus Peregrinibacteria bacterium CG2_30_44_17]|nr:MAG: peptide-methionine (S)-S-oxide reductase [Candidatus Peregrinibacteria bacterium CG2_30_44_17]